MYVHLSWYSVGDESAAEIVKTVGKMPSDVTEAYGHMEIGRKAGIIRQSAMNFSGQRFVQHDVSVICLISFPFIFNMKDILSRERRC